MNRTPARPYCFCPSALLLASAVFTPGASAQTGEKQDEYGGTLTPAEATTVDKTQRVVSKSINDAAQWVDSFFDDERFIAEDASTTLRLSQAVLVEYGESSRYKTRANVKVDIPRFKNKLKLFVADEADDREKTVTEAPFGTLQNTDNEATVGLQYFTKATDKLNISLTGGVKVDSAELFIGPRLRRNFKLENWQLRFTQRVRWFTEKGWEATTRFDLERLLSDKLFLRHTADGRWREEDDGYRYEIGPTLTQLLANKKAVVYQWNNLFRTRPNHRLDESILRIRYRQRIWRKWLFYEIDPQLAFRNDEEFDPKAGIVFLLEVVFGGKDR